MHRWTLCLLLLGVTLFGPATADIVSKYGIIGIDDSVRAGGKLKGKVFLSNWSKQVFYLEKIAINVYEKSSDALRGTQSLDFSLRPLPPDSEHVFDFDIPISGASAATAYVKVDFWGDFGLTMSQRRGNLDKLEHNSATKNVFVQILASDSAADEPGVFDRLRRIGVGLVEGIKRLFQ